MQALEESQKAEDKIPVDLSRMEFKRFAKIMTRGEAAFDLHVRPKLRPEDDGLFVAIDVDTGDYEIDSSNETALRTLHERRPTANIWVTMIGRAKVQSKPPGEAVGP